MSALGHKRTYAVQKGMSALPPKADMCGATRYVRFVPIADIALGELCAITDEKQRDRLGHKAASKRDKGGDRGDGAGALVLQTERRFTLLRNTLSELIKSGLFFGETTFYKAFLFSGQECPQNFSVSFDVCLVREQQVISRV